MQLSIVVVFAILLVVGVCYADPITCYYNDTESKVQTISETIITGSCYGFYFTANTNGIVQYITLYGSLQSGTGGMQIAVYPPGGTTETPIAVSDTSSAGLVAREMAFFFPNSWQLSAGTTYYVQPGYAVPSATYLIYIAAAGTEGASTTNGCFTNVCTDVGECSAGTFYFAVTVSGDCCYPSECENGGFCNFASWGSNNKPIGSCYCNPDNGFYGNLCQFATNYTTTVRVTATVTMSGNPSSVNTTAIADATASELNVPSSYVTVTIVDNAKRSPEQTFYLSVAVVFRVPSAAEANTTDLENQVTSSVFSDTVQNQFHAQNVSTNSVTTVYTVGSTTSTGSIGSTTSIKTSSASFIAPNSFVMLLFILFATISSLL